MTRQELQAAISKARSAAGDEGPIIVVDFMEAEPLGGWGVVAYVRDDDYEPFVVHRWATVAYNGEAIPFRLWSGGYYDHAQHWMLDFVERSGRATQPVTAD